MNAPFFEINKINCYVDSIYSAISGSFSKVPCIIAPYFRRFLRLVALPYYFLFLINWDECRVSKVKVFYDIVYIFFSLKTYPFHYSLCRLWEIDRRTWKYYYGSNYEPYQRARLSKNIQPKKYSIIFDDKEICYQLCKSFDIPLPEQVAIVDPSGGYVEKIDQLLSEFCGETLIIKPVLGSGGKNIILAYNKDGNVVIRDKNSICSIDKFVLRYRSVVQKYLKQHPCFSVFSGGFSTVRVVTLLTKYDDVLVVGAFIRFSLGGSYVDNLSSGGIAVGVDVSNGTLKKYAYDFKSLKYDCHPDTQQPFRGFVIPEWEKILEVAKNVQKSFPYYKLLGIDIGLTLDGPVVVEINPSHDNVALEQSFGPVLANQLVLGEFRDYDLLVVDPFDK